MMSLRCILLWWDNASHSQWEMAQAYSSDKYDPVTCQAKVFARNATRHLNKMTGETEVLRPLVEACLDNDPVKLPSILNCLGD